MNAVAKPQAVRLLPVRAAWIRAGLFVAKLTALGGLSLLLVVTLTEVAAIAARMQ